MKNSLSAGIRGELTTQVGPGQTITLGGDQRTTVFSTPSMINLMEHAAREALRPHLEPGEESVGVDVQISHSAATPPKSQVTATAIVTNVEKNVITFDVVARDPWGEIGRGTHRRAVIKTERFAQRLAEQKPMPSVASASSAELPILKTIDCKLTGELLRVTLNRPRKRNAISADMTAELERLVSWLAASPAGIRVVIVAGSNQTFCAGDDVGEIPDDPIAARELSIRRGSLYRQITELPQVFVAAIDGPALGGGFILAAACDFRIATHRATLGLPEVSLGWPPNYGLGIVNSLIGRGRALELTLSGEIIDARRAEAIGFVNRVVPQTQMGGEVKNLVNALLRLPAEALSAAKQQLSPTREWCDERAADTFVACLSTDAARKNIARFKS